MKGNGGSRRGRVNAVELDLVGDSVRSERGAGGGGAPPMIKGTDSDLRSDTVRTLTAGCSPISKGGSRRGAADAEGGCLGDFVESDSEWMRESHYRGKCTGTMISPRSRREIQGLFRAPDGSPIPQLPIEPSVWPVTRAPQVVIDDGTDGPYPTRVRKETLRVFGVPLNLCL